MNRTAQSILVVLTGGTLLGITWSGRYMSYVKPGFGPLLTIAGIVLVVVGLVSLIVIGRRHAAELAARFEASADQTPSGTSRPRPDGQREGGGRADGDADRRLPDAHDHEGELGAHGHDHDRSRAPWLMLAPVLVLLVLAPPALGADAVARNAGSQALAGLADLPADQTASDSGAVSTPALDPGDKSGVGGGEGYAFNDGSGHGVGTKNFDKHRPRLQFPALPAGADPAVGLRDFVMRALYDGDNSVSDNAVTVTGFIAGSGDGYTGGYSIARLVISCCAADANPMRIHVDGNLPMPENTWVRAVVKAVPDSATTANDYVPTVELVSVQQTSQPSDPYEH